MTKKTETDEKRIAFNLAIPTELLLGAEMCTSKEEARYYLNGVFIHAKDDTTLRIMSTDGHALFVAQIDYPAGMPTWFNEGVIISNENLKPMLKMVDKLNGDGFVRLRIPPDGGRCTLGDTVTVDFHPALVDGKFPAVDSVIGSAEEALTGVERLPGECVGFASRYVKLAAEVAKAINPEKDAISTLGFFLGDPKCPAVVTMTRPGVFLILMPMTGPIAGAETLKALEPAVKRTIGALKAHRTRLTDALPDLTGDAKVEAEAKVADFDRRIIYFSTGKMPPPAIEDKREPAVIARKPMTVKPGSTPDDTIPADPRKAPANKATKPKATKTVKAAKPEVGNVTKLDTKAKATVKAKKPETVH